jgi:tRNA modification GTPase
MIHPHEQDTIAALATPSGEGGIAVVRMSGTLAPKILGQIFHIIGAKHSVSPNIRNGSSLLTDWKSHYLYYGKLIAPEGEFLDQGLAVWMKAPRSFTGEEVVEFHLHGGRRIALRILETIYKMGARPAEAGEFTQRAFLNGKIDLTQAEAVADMIAAQSDRALKLAQAQWQGALSRPVSELRRSLLDLLVHLEAAIDFPEEDIEIIDRPTTQALLDRSIRQIDTWLADYELGRILREGLIVVLIGKPNVGKSSLLNLLSREEAAIVHHQPGTTRDAIERLINLGGLAVRLIDTAGIREAKGEVEGIGIERSRQWFEKADLVLALFDTSSPLDPEDYEIAELASKKKSIFIFNKIDMPPAWDLHPTAGLIKKIPGEIVSLSAKTGEGLKDLEKKIPKMFSITEFEKGDHLFLNQLRHKEALEKGRAALCSASEALKRHYSPEFVTTDILAATNHLGEIIGEVTTEHILEDIFGRFCIGK